MSATPPPFELPFPLGTGLVRNAPADFQALAEQVAAFLLFTESRTVTASTTLEIGDASRVLRVDTSSNTTITIPTNASVAFPVGTVIGVYNSGTGTATIAGASGVTVRNAGPIDTQFLEVSLRKRATNEWVVAGL